MSEITPPRQEKPEASTLLTRNDGSLCITFIGAGSAFTKKFYQNNALVVKGDDHVLIDCGTRTPEALAKLGLSVTDIRNYLITHSHADHIGGLEEVMLMNRYVAKRKTTMVAPRAYREFLWKHSLKGGAAYNERVGGKILRFDDFWDGVDLEPVPGADRQLCEASVGSIRLAMFRTMHIPDSAPGWRSSAPSYGVVIDGRILFTGDTRYDPGLFDFLAGRYSIEAAFHDCQLFRGGVHASLEELRGLAAPVKAITSLMHFGDSADAYAEKAREYGFKGFVEQWKPYVFA
ncbi:MAG: MBL fold metallo-hydrolase [Spirochaetes bacterium]|nr:MBL fold metallo-hydrolase [Spirochaetota bacterium]